MSYPMFLNLQQKQAQSLRQTQKLIMMPQMQQAIALLQLPVLELSAIVEEEVQQNPLLEYSQSEEGMGEERDDSVYENEAPSETEVNFDEHNFEVLRLLDEEYRDHFAESGNFIKKRTVEDEKSKTFQENSIQGELTLFEHLMKQAQETFDTKEKLKAAEQLIGNFDNRGFLQTSLEEISLLANVKVQELEETLKEIQTFEPFGVGAKDLQESFLIQLRCLGKDRSLAYELLKECYDHLLHNRIPLIQKQLNCTKEDIEAAIATIAKLDLHPGAWHSKQVVQYVTTDVTLRLEGEQLIAEVDDDTLPHLKLNFRYMRMLDDENLPKETKDFIKQKLISAKWLVRNIYQRNETLIRIAESLAKIQSEFFLNPDGKLIPLTMKVIAEELGLHESTIARAVSNKYINSPRGIFPLRFFFTSAYVGESGDDISSRTVREALEELIRKEDKHKPLSDEALSAALKAKGINCARRTIAKYRTELNLGNAFQRKKY